MDAVDTKLGEAGRLRERSAAELAALNELVASRTSIRRRPARHRRALPALVIGGLVATAGAGAAAATQWGPWNYVAEGDLTITRDWVDIHGAALGTCESRLAVDELPADALRAARDHLDRVDVDALEPDPEVVASRLVAVGRPDRLDQLIAGADVADFDITHTGPLWEQGWWSDARILQDGLVQVVFTGMADELVTTWPELGSATASITSRVQTQCTTDPAGEGAE